MNFTGALWGPHIPFSQLYNRCFLGIEHKRFKLQTNTRHGLFEAVTNQVPASIFLVLCSVCSTSLTLSELEAIPHAILY
jgi:hypothetical protein